jgi:hypothetical protein
LTTNFIQQQTVFAEDGEIFYASSNYITSLPTIIINQYDFTPNQASLGTVFEIVTQK